MVILLTQGETLTVSGTCEGATALAFTFGGASKGSQPLAIEAGCYKGNIATDTLLPGNFEGQVWATYADSSRKIISKVLFKIAAPLKDGQDTRSTARRSYDAICEMLAGRATDGVKRYQIGGRELERYSLTELRALKKDLVQQIRRESGWVPGKIRFIG